MTFEQGFAEAERAASAAGKVVRDLAAAVKQLQKGAAEGDLFKMQKACDRLATCVESTRQDVLNARSAWPFSAEEEEAYLREFYAEELVETAKAEQI